ncbi:MAG: DUF5689 domain-containing protein [Bacteroidales bacterium]|nr:DUF5689 domain-containing protein [Bacteroidales bacterium]
MKNYRIISGLLALFTMTVLLFSCVDDDFDTPKTQTLPVGKLKTIADLKAMTLDAAITEDASVYGVITMDDKKGNIYKTAYMQDATGAIALHFETSGGIYQGDSVRLYLKNLKVGKYRELFQVDAVDGNGFNLDYHIVKIKTQVEVTPVVTTISEINQNKPNFQGKLVKLENVEFVPGDTAVNYANAADQQSLSLHIQDAQGETMIVRTSGYSSIAEKKTPTGNGSIIAIVGQFNNDMQLLIRTTDEVVMTGERISSELVTPEGTGEKADPYNVAAAVANNSGNRKWVRGYIVGVAQAGKKETVFDFDAPFSSNSNILIADNPQERNSNNVLIVQLPSSSSAVRTALNLQDNAANKGKQVSVRGTLISYFNQPGMKSTFGCIIDGNEHGETDDIPGIFYEETFPSNISAFSTFSVTGDQEWEWAHYGAGCAKMTGYVSNVSNANEDWLVSPRINLSTKTNVKLILKEAINFIASYDDLQVLVSTDYDGTSNPNSQGTWTALSIASRPAGDSWDFQSSGDIDLSTYDGQATFYIAFKYLSSTSSRAVWEIGNILLREAN